MPETTGGAAHGAIRVVPDAFVSGLAKARFVRIQLPDGAAGSLLSADDVSALISHAEFDFASVRLPVEAEDVIAAFADGGFYLAETLVTYRHDLTQAPDRMPVGAEWLEGVSRESSDARDVGEIGRLAFKFDRFHSDGNIDNKLADFIKQEWSINNVTGRGLGTVVMRSGSEGSSTGQITGFCEIAGDAESSAIDLIAVHPQWQRQGLARRLMKGTLFALSRRGMKQMFVGTASTNTASRALYEAMGCREAKREVTLHWASGKIKA